MTGLREYFILVLIPISIIIKSVLSCACYHLYIFLGETPIQAFCLFFFVCLFVSFNWVVCFNIELCELFVYFGYWPLLTWRVGFPLSAIWIDWIGQSVCLSSGITCMNVWVKPICCFLLAWNVSSKKSADNFMEVPFGMILFFSPWCLTLLHFYFLPFCLSYVLCESV